MEGQIQMDPVKIKGISTWLVPNSKKDVQSFLGFCNFYHCFIKDFAKIAWPLHDLTGNIPFIWTKEQTYSFNQLKSLITSAPIISILNNKRPFCLEADTSDFMIGAVLSQKQENKWKPIVFLSKLLMLMQHNYEIYDKELLAIMLALGEFQ